jgi:GNAT superfamily N-acetyltransferase
LYLGAMFVHSGSRGHGLGVAPVRAIEAHASRLGHPAIYLNAADALTRPYDALI